MALGPSIVLLFVDVVFGEKGLGVVKDGRVERMLCGWEQWVCA